MGHPGEIERVFVQCLPGLEQVLETEARSLGRVRRVSGGVEIEGLPGLHAQAVLVLRVAEQVLLRLLEAPARRWDEVESAIKTASLDRVVIPGAPVALEMAVRMPSAPTPRAFAGVLEKHWRRPVQVGRS